MNPVTIYWDFLRRPSPSSSSTRGFEVLPKLPRDVLLLTAFFSAVFLLAKFVAISLWPTWYRSLPRRKQLEFPSYILCLVHHFVAVPTAWYRVRADFLQTEADLLTVDYAPLTATIAPWCIAYLITDGLFYAIPEALKGKLDMLAHHVLVLFLVASSLYGPGSILRFIPHLLISDTTNIFFNLAWLFRLAGWNGSTIVAVCEVLFAASFLFVRVINMPLMFLALSQLEEASGLGPARFVLLPVAVLQW